MKTIERSIGDVAYVSGQKVYLDIPRDYWYRQIFLYLSGSVTIGTANATGVRLESPLSLIKRIELVLNGKDTIKSLPFYAIYQKTKVMHQTAPSITVPGLTQAAQAFAAGAILDLGLWDGISKTDTMLKALGASTLQLSVDWETITNGLVVPDVTTTLTMGNCTLHVISNEAFNVDPKAVFPVNREYSLNMPINANGIYQLQLPTGNMYWGLLLRTVDNGALSDGVINKLTVKSGTEVFRYFSKAAALKETFKTEKSIESLTTGYYWVPFTRDGLLSEALDARLMSNLILEIDATFGTATTIEVFPQEIIVPRS
jgi:hypothetical protein